MARTPARLRDRQPFRQPIDITRSTVFQRLGNELIVYLESLESTVVVTGDMPRISG